MFGRVSKEVAIFFKSYNKMGPGVRAANADMKSLEKTGSQVFKRIAQAATAAFTAIAAGSIMVGAAFEQGLANTSSMFITAAKDAQELGRWTTELAAKARQLGRETAFTAREATDAMYALASGGLAANEVIEASNSVLMLAGATMTGMTEAAEVTMSTLRQFSLEAQDSARVTNVFAAGIQNSMLNMSRLTFSMQFAGPMAAALGMKIEGTVAALGLLHNAGLKGSLAGTGLRMTFTKLLKPNAELKAALGGLSVQADGLSDVLKRLDEQDIQPDRLARMFGPRAFGAIRALLKAGQEGFDEMRDSVTGTNAAADMYARQMNTVRSQTLIMKAAMEDTGIAIFEVLKPSLMDIIKTGQKFVNETRPQFEKFFKGMVEAAQKAWPHIKSFTVDLIAAFDEVWDGVKALKDPLKAVIGFLADHPDEIVATAKAIVLVNIALLGTSKVLKGIVVLMNVVKASPWILALTAIAGAFVFLVEKMGGFKIFLINLEFAWKRSMINMSNGFQRMGSEFLFWLESIKQVPQVITRIWTMIGSIFKDGGDMIGKIMTAIKDSIMNPFSGGDLFESLGKILEEGFKSIAENSTTDWGDLIPKKAEEDYNVRMSGLKSNLIKELLELRKWHREQLGFMLGAGGPGAPVELAPPQVTFGPSTMRPEVAAAMLGFPVLRQEDIQALMAGFVDTTKTESDKVLDVWKELGDGIRDVAQGAWDSIISTSMTGAEKWKAIWSDGSKFIWSLLGKTVIAKLAGDKIILASSVTTNAAEQAANTKTAATGFFKAYAGMPFIGQVLALGAIAAMMGAISSMHTGGLIGGSNGTGSFQEQMILGQRGEFVMPVRQTQQNLPLLEAIRSGRSPALSAAGGRESTSLHVESHLHVGQGSLLLADDDLALRRMADKLHVITKDRIEKTFREI